MLFLLKHNIRTTLLLLLFITTGTYLLAGNIQGQKNEKRDQLNPENRGRQNDYKGTDTNYYYSKDTVLTGQSVIGKTESSPNEKFSIPPEQEKIPINFRINSSISYLSLKNFANDESKKLFFQAWLKEIELRKLSVQTDSLRKAYSMASTDQKEGIAALILKAEKQTIDLNGEIPDMYQKAREEEDRYWQTASPDEIIKFHVKIRLYKDSMDQVAGLQSKQEAIPSGIADTFNLYKPSSKAVEKKAVVPAGIIYKIQIGAYKGKIPEPSSKLIKKLSIIRKVENYVDDKGMKIYTTGNLRMYPEAVTMLSQVKQEGIKNAVINAYQNGQKITVVQARKLNKEL